MKEPLDDTMDQQAKSSTVSAVEDDLCGFLNRVKCLITDSVLSLGAFLPSTYQELIGHHFTGGKLVRTQAMFLLARCVGRKDIDCLAQTASALELVHRSTLLIDDMVDRSSSRNETQAAYLDLGPTKTTLLSNLFTAKGVGLCPDSLRQDLLHASEQLNLGQLAPKQASFIRLQCNQAGDFIGAQLSCSSRLAG